MALDHELLKLPLKLRGDVDAQIDAYKRGQAINAKAARKAAAEILSAQRKEAKALVAEMTPERLQAFSDRLKLPPAQLRKRLNAIAHWEPLKLIVVESAREKRLASIA